MTVTFPYNSLLLTKKTVEILLDKDLRYNLHVDNLNKKGTSLLQYFSNLKRYGIITDISIFVYSSYATPSLEYKCPAWHPGLMKVQPDRQEMVQKKNCKMIFGHNYSTNDDALIKLNLN